MAASSSQPDPSPDGATPPDVDALDRAIIAQLQRDGRRAYRAIARDLGVAETTVRFRATRLQRTG